ncbi:MAG: hypothetical protein ACJ77E_14330 [Gaiellaceae bacterium]
MLRAVLAAVVALVVVLVPTSTAARPHVTLIADSVAGALLWDSAAAAIFSHGLEADLELRSCRRLASPSCAAAGESAPPSALDLIRARGRGIGRNVLIAVGYNDSPDIYARGIEQTLAALRADGVEQVFWMTLRAVGGEYLESNAAIFAAAKRHPELTVLDWNAHARGHDEWFQADGLHPVDSGARAMARFMHDQVLDVLLAPPPAPPPPPPPPPPPIEISIDFPRSTVSLGPFATLRASGGHAPYRFVVHGLPAALHAHVDGTITGVPSSGSWTLRVRIVDAKGRDAEKAIELVVSP